MAYHIEVRPGACWRLTIAHRQLHLPVLSCLGAWAFGLSIVGPEAQNKSAWASSGEVIPLQPQTWRSENTWKWVFLVHKISIFWRCTYCPNISYQCRWKDTLKSQTKIGMEVLLRRNGTTFSTPLGCPLPSKLMKLLIISYAWSDWKWHLRNSEDLEVVVSFIVSCSPVTHFCANWMCAIIIFWTFFVFAEKSFLWKLNL